LSHVEDRWYRTGPSGRKVKTARHGKGLRWKARIQGSDGKEHAKSFARKEDAERYETTTAADVHRGTWLDPDAGKVTLRDYAEGWLSIRDLAPSTREALEMRLRKHVYPVLGHRTLAQLSANPELIQAWLAGLGISSSYAKVVFTTLSAILSSAVSSRKIASSPCRDRNAVQRPKAASRPVVPWSAAQVAAVRTALPEQWQILVDLGSGLGLRQGEIFGLAVSDVDFLRRVVHVRRQVRIIRSRLVFAPPKGNKLRDVPLPESVALALAGHLEHHPARPVTLPWEEPGGSPETAELIMTSVTGKAINRNTFNTYGWKPVLAAAGIPAGRANGCHALRHYFASTLLHHGVGIKAVSDYLGHSSPTITLDIYAHVMPAAHDQMRAVIDASAQDHGPATAQAGTR
jgi:integrase